MTDDEFLLALENCTLMPVDFDHHAHVRAAYLYLRKHEFAVAYMSLIQQHRHERGDNGDWGLFSSANPELFVRNLLRRFYSDAELQSATARHIFVLPRYASISIAPMR